MSVPLVALDARPGIHLPLAALEQRIAEALALGGLLGHAHLQILALHLHSVSEGGGGGSQLSGMAEHRRQSSAPGNWGWRMAGAWRQPALQSSRLQRFTFMQSLSRMHSEYCVGGWVGGGRVKSHSECIACGEAVGFRSSGHLTTQQATLSDQGPVFAIHLRNQATTRAAHLNICRKLGIAQTCRGFGVRPRGCVALVSHAPISHPFLQLSPIHRLQSVPTYFSFGRLQDAVDPSPGQRHPCCCCCPHMRCPHDPAHAGIHHGHL